VMNVLDWALVLVAVAYAVTGFRRGFVIGAAMTVGLLAGGALGVLVTPKLLARFSPSLTLSFVALLCVLLCASLGQALGGVVGGAVRRRITWQPASALDSLGGAALSVTAALLVAWALGVAASGAGLPVIGPEVRSSAVLSRVNGALPGQADRLLQKFTDLVDSNLYPRYLEPFVTERIKPVKPPTAAVLRDSQVVQAGRSVVKIRGISTQCSRSLEGSGFVYARGRVLTNAHVVAGTLRSTVTVNGRTLSAVPVVYDPSLDVAVLAVRGLGVPRLHFEPRARLAEVAAVLGYPENGPFNAQPARIRDEQRLQSPDIYGDGSVTRDVLSLYARVRPGNSGGPLVSRRGKVLGMVFAASVSNRHTAYAVSAAQIRPDAAAGRGATTAVSTGGCS
jgi:S1-C subfamily serine protease